MSIHFCQGSSWATIKKVEGDTRALRFEITSASRPPVQRDVNPSHALTSAIASTDFN